MDQKLFASQKSGMTEAISRNYPRKREAYALLFRRCLAPAAGPFLPLSSTTRPADGERTVSTSLLD